MRIIRRSSAVTNHDPDCRRLSVKFRYVSRRPPARRLPCCRLPTLDDARRGESTRRLGTRRRLRRLGRLDRSSPAVPLDRSARRRRSLPRGRQRRGTIRSRRPERSNSAASPSGLHLSELIDPPPDEVLRTLRLRRLGLRGRGRRARATSSGRGSWAWARGRRSTRPEQGNARVSARARRTCMKVPSREQRQHRETTHLGSENQPSADLWRTRPVMRVRRPPDRRGSNAPGAGAGPLDSLVPQRRRLMEALHRRRRLDASSPARGRRLEALRRSISSSSTDSPSVCDPQLAIPHYGVAGRLDDLAGAASAASVPPTAG